MTFHDYMRAGWLFHAMWLLINEDVPTNDVRWRALDDAWAARDVVEAVAA